MIDICLFVYVNLYAGVEVQLPALCHPRFTSLQAQHEEGKALETFVQSVVLKCVPCVRTPRRRRQR